MILMLLWLLATPVWAQSAADGFDPNANGTVYSLAVQADGKVLVGGYFTQIGGQARNRIARLNADGTLDAGFNPAASSAVLNLAVQADGKVLAGGAFTQIGGQARHRIARLNADGTLDAGFDPAANDWVWSLAVQADGKLLVGGAFTQIGGQARNSIARLNADGTLDAGFNPADNDAVTSLAVQADGKVLVGGQFTQIDGQARQYIARLTVPEAALQALDVGADRTSVIWQRSGSGPELHAVGFERSDDGIVWSPLGAATRSAGGWSLGGLSLPRNQNLSLRARGMASGGYSNASGSLIESVRLVYLAVPVVTATVQAGQGQVTPATQNIDPGMDAAFSVTPDPGWHVDAVTGDTCTPVHVSGNDWSAANISADCAVTVTFAIDAWTVTASADANGAITPPKQDVDHGGSASFTVTPDANHHVVSVTGDTCTPVHISGNNWTAANISADCAVTATFAIDTWTVTASADASGAITPPTQDVDHGGSASFTVTPDANHHVVAVAGDTCTPVQAAGDQWTAANITAACAVTATFAIDTHAVTATAVGNGSITPASQTVGHGESIIFTVIPANGHHIDHVSGDTCTLTHDAGDLWISDPITANCAITASFAIDPADLVLSLDDGRDYARYGRLLTYVVTLSNQGSGPANGAEIAMTLPAQLDHVHTAWVCLNAGAGAVCSDSGQGALIDNDVVIPAGRSLTWLVTSPVRTDALGDAVETTINASDGVTSISASDTNTLVILRDGFDVPYGDGTQGDAWFTDDTNCFANPVAETLDDSFLHSFTLPAAAASLFDSVLVARADNGNGFRVERVNLADIMLVRLLASTANGQETASTWAEIKPGSSLVLATVTTTADQQVLLLEGAASALSLPLPADTAWRVQKQASLDASCHQ